MKNSVRDNIFQRIIWLDNVQSGKVKPTQAQLLRLGSLRDFCTLEVSGSFTSISYNSLKTHARTTPGSEFNVPDVSNLWEYIKQLRQHASTVTGPGAGVPTRSELPNSEKLYSTALLEAHLCSMAYFEIYRFLENLAATEIDDTNPLIPKIAHQLSVFRAKFSSIVSPRGPNEGRTFEVIPGGRL